MAVVDVGLGGRSYRVVAEKGLLAELPRHAGPVLRKARVQIVADAAARRHWGPTIDDALRAAGHEPRWFDVTPGEASKSWEGLARLTDWLIAEGVERADHVFALGGGVVGDLTGFACAVLKRGCGFVQLPTTLLAQVDSSVGGKTAINTGAGKNLVGAFHQPSLVIADLGTLSTLPVRELRSGYAEVLKYGVLGDAPFFDWLAANGEAVLGLGEEPLEHAVAHSIAMKARIVATDERETSGARALLNLGHTFGHALEAATAFSDRLLHGESVGLGMVLAARYSVRLGLMDAAEADRINRTVAAAHLPTDISTLDLGCDGVTLTAHMLHDKKMDAGTLPFVLLRGIGQAFLARNIDLADVASFLDEELRRG